MHCGCWCCCRQRSHCCRCCWWRGYFDHPHSCGHFCSRSPQDGQGHPAGVRLRQGPQSSHRKSLAPGRWWWRSGRSWSSRGGRSHRTRWTTWHCPRSACRRGSSRRTAGERCRRWRVCCAGLTLQPAPSACCHAGSRSRWATNSCCDHSRGSLRCPCSEHPGGPFHSVHCGCPFWYQSSSGKRSFWLVNSH